MAMAMDMVIVMEMEMEMGILKPTVMGNRMDSLEIMVAMETTKRVGLHKKMAN